MIRSPLRAGRIVKWTGLAMCALLGSAWVVSQFMGGAYIGATTTLGVSRGAVGMLVYTPDPGDYIGWIGYRLNAVDPRWWPSYDDRTSPQTSTLPRLRTRRLFVPLWIPLLPATIATVILWRRDRIPPGHCRQCGYNLTGNVSGRCSECGHAI